MRTVTLTAILAAAVLGLAFTTDAEAQQRNQELPEPMYRIPGSQPEPDRVNRQTGLTERTFNTLTSIHQDFGEENYESARQRLIALMERGRLTDYERALLMQNLGFVYAVTDRPREALQQFSGSMAIDALSHRETQNMLLTMAQLYAIDEQWQPAIRTMTRYFYWEDSPTPDSLILMATAYAALDDFRNGLIWVQRAIEHADEPRENWYQLWLAMHFQQGDYQASADVLARMIALWPGNARYWEQLAGILMELGREADALAVLAMAYQQGMLTEESKLMNLVRFYQYRNVPYTAARILRKGIDDGIVEPTEEHWELLSQSYQAAEERQDAIRALQRAAALSDDGELFIREAQLHASVDNWEGVRRAARDGLDKGGLRNTGRAWMMLGIAAFEDRAYQEALRAFRQAASHPDARTRANQWINYVNNRIRTERALREGL
jgi:tetratricopeptide (TPR) repeat protein